MFEASDKPRVFSVPLGVDLPRALVKGLEARLSDQPAQRWAEVQIFVNTRRMQRRITTLLCEGPPRLHPRIHTISDIAHDPLVADLPPPVPPLRRRLELTQLVSHLLDQEPDLAPRASLYSLADSLADLMDEMQGEGVSPEALKQLDVGNLSGHWERSLRFLSIVDRYFGAQSREEPDVEARQRKVIERLVATWENAPPSHPVIVAGSTGSRGATALFMRAVAQLPQGAIVLPGFDTDQPDTVWQNLNDAMTGEDHPQFRFARLMSALSLTPADIHNWADSIQPKNAARNRLVSLALRPAPVTDQWMQEGQHFSRPDIESATRRITLIEAPSPRAEAVAIALRLRQAVEDGQQAALITPDRNLTRQVTAALDRWNIEPDDSAGRPLTLSPPGRFLRHVSELFGRRLTAANLLVLLKHPLCHSGHGRGDHLRWTRDLELEKLRRGLPFPTLQDLEDWSNTKHATDQDRLVWVRWIMGLVGNHADLPKAPLSEMLERHLQLAQALSAGVKPNSDHPYGGLWDKAAGREAKHLTDTMRAEAGYGGVLSPADYVDLFRTILNTGEVRDPDTPHPGVMIWGTMEARVQGADLVILAGLNDGVWPKLPSPDAWLNRMMRHDAGLLLPERRIGLSAHDFQLAIAAPEVVLSRAVRDAESETVPSRWVNRLTNLLEGLPEGGTDIIQAMRDRGNTYLAMATQLDLRSEGALPPAKRPSPRPPVQARPKQLSVTRINRLVRDPYAIYAESILNLRALDPLQHAPDAPLRGTILHQIVEEYIGGDIPPDKTDARKHLMDIADRVLEEQVPWPAARILWRAKLDLVVDSFILDEVQRQKIGRNFGNELRGSVALDPLDFTLTGTADRIDVLTDGGLAVYDYKSGKFPGPQDQKLFDKQLRLEAVIAEAGGFKGLKATPVSNVAYIALGKPLPFKPMWLDDGDIATTRAELLVLIGKYQSREQGYTSLRLDPKLGYPSDFEHLARLGEWDISQMPEPEDVGQ